MEGVTEGGATDCSAHAVAECASTAPTCGLGASKLGVDSAVVLETGCGFGRSAFQEVVTVGRLLMQVTEMNLSMPSCSIAQFMPESADTEGSPDTLAQGTSTATPCSLGAWAFSFESRLVSGDSYNLGKAAPQEEVSVGRTLKHVAVTVLAAQHCLVAEGVPASGKEDGNAHTSSYCASTATMCGLGTSIIVLDLDSTVVSAKDCDLGWAVPEQVVAVVVVESPLIQETAVVSNTPSCLAAEGVTESGAAHAIASAGALDYHADTDPICGLVLLVFGLNPRGISKPYCEFGKARQVLVCMHRQLQQVAATVLDPACGHGESTFGLNSIKLSKADFDLTVNHLRKSAPLRHRGFTCRPLVGIRSLVHLRSL